jgi:hypothetical protein
MPERKVNYNNIIKYLTEYKDLRREHYPNTSLDFYKNINDIINNLKLNKAIEERNHFILNDELVNEHIEDTKKILELLGDKDE